MPAISLNHPSVNEGDHVIVFTTKMPPASHVSITLQ